MIQPGRRFGALLALALAVAGTPASAQQTPPPAFSLDLAETPAQQVTLSVPAQTSVPIRIIHNGGPAANVTLDLGVFRNDQGATLPVTFTVGADNANGVNHLEQQSVTQPVLPLNLHVGTFPSGGAFHGTLLLSAPNGTGGALQTTSWQFNLSSAADVRPATLVLDQTTAPLTASRPWCLLFVPDWCFGGQVPTVTVHVFDKTGAFALNGVAARLDSGLAGPGSGFDPARHINATFNGARADLFATPAAGTRDILPHEQATVTLTFRSLPAGDYTIPVRFTAANSAADNAQLLSVSLKLRNNVIGAVLVLILAAMMSFLATRVVVMLRQRAAFLQQLAILRPAWLADEPPLLPVIWLRATLRQAEVLSQRHWLSTQDQISARLTTAAATLGVLNQVRQVREQIASGIQDAQVRRRAEWALARVVRQIGAGPLADAEVTRLKGLLDALNAWTTSAQQDACYWADLRPSIVARCAEVQPTDLPNAAQTSGNGLLTTLRAALATEPPDLAAKNAAEAALARLSIMWELRNHAEPLAILLGLPNWPNAQIDRVYQVVDDFWWATLRALPAGDLVIEGPADDAVDAFEPVTFRVRATDPALNGCYLFNNKLTWHWTINVRTTPSRWAVWRIARNRPPLSAVSSEPRIAQYSPEPSQLSASVRVTYQGHQGPAATAAQAVAVQRSTDFSAWNFFEAADVLSTVLALLASIISGVALYALAPSFGSLKDYLALFTWGAGLDQGKNFLQSLAAYSGPATPQK